LKGEKNKMMYKVNKNSTISVDYAGRRWLNGKSRFYYPDGTVDIIWGRVAEDGPDRYVAGETHYPDGTVKCWIGSYEDAYYDEYEDRQHESVDTTWASEFDAHVIFASWDGPVPFWTYERPDLFE
jgi:hypothetical protein